MRAILCSAFLSVVSSYALAAEFEAGPTGGGGGTPFFDNPPPAFARIDSLTICGGTIVDSIDMVYRDIHDTAYHYGKHGGTGGTCQMMHFSAGEYIVEISGKTGSRVDSMTVRTNYGQTLTKGGTGGVTPYLYTGNAQFQIAGMKGRSGRQIDAIGVVYFQVY